MDDDRRTRRRNLAILAASGIVLATVMATLAACTEQNAAPAVLNGVTAPTATPVNASSSATVPAPSAAHRRAFLAELDHWRVPRSASGQAEVQIGIGVCTQLAAGVTVGMLTQQLTAITWTLDQAGHVVAAARGELCHG